MLGMVVKAQLKDLGMIASYANDDGATVIIVQRMQLQRFSKQGSTSWGEVYCYLN